MWDPNMEPYLPLECRKRKQAVIFFENNHAGVLRGDYRYDHALLKQIESQPDGSLQLSYLWVHEWLWTYFDQTQFISSAVFNRLLQSEKLGTISDFEYQQLRKQYLKFRVPARPRSR